MELASLHHLLTEVTDKLSPITGVPGASCAAGQKLRGGP
jgi:hypothetical protein